MTTWETLAYRSKHKFLACGLDSAGSGEGLKQALGDLGFHKMQEISILPT
jgi:hypothetical protein